MATALCQSQRISFIQPTLINTTPFVMQLILEQTNKKF